MDAWQAEEWEAFSLANTACELIQQDRLRASKLREAEASFQQAMDRDRLRETPTMLGQPYIMLGDVGKITTTLRTSEKTFYQVPVGVHKKLSEAEEHALDLAHEFMDNFREYRRMVSPLLEPLLEKDKLTNEEIELLDRAALHHDQAKKVYRLIGSLAAKKYAKKA